MESSEIVSDGATHEFNIHPQHGQGGCVIDGHTQMNKQRQYIVLSWCMKHERSQAKATSTEAQLGLLPGKVCHIYCCTLRHAVFSIEVP